MRKPSEIRKDWEAATPGPWQTAKLDGVTAVDMGWCNWMVEGHWNTPDTPKDTELQEGLDAKAIANAPTDVIGLLDWVERAKENIAASVKILEDALKDCNHFNCVCVLCTAKKLLKELE